MFFCAFECFSSSCEGRKKEEWQRMDSDTWVLWELGMILTLHRLPYTTLLGRQQTVISKLMLLHPQLFLPCFLIACGCKSCILCDFISSLSFETLCECNSEFQASLPALESHVHLTRKHFKVILLKASKVLWILRKDLQYWFKLELN